MQGACCPGKAKVTILKVGGQTVGVSHLAEIIDGTMKIGEATNEELRADLLRNLKIYNYVPSGAEAEYVEAVWLEFLKRRGTRDTERTG